MTSSRASGKADFGFMEDVVYRSLGRRDPRLLVGPAKGFDNAVLSLGGGRVMAFTVDPVSLIPKVGASASGWLSVHLIASDLATSGIMPEYATFSFNFPGEVTRPQRAAFVRSIGEECGRLGVSIAAGHTGSYPGAGLTVVGAGSMFGFGREGAFVDPSMSRAGDRILVTKGAAIEAAAVLSWSFPERTRSLAGRRTAAMASAMIRDCSVVRDAAACASVGLGRGAVTSMHDATEGGVLGGLEEMASASGNAFHVDRGLVPVRPEAKAVCSAFGIDPLCSMGEGALLVTCSPRALRALAGALAAAGIEAREIGTVRGGSGLWVAEGGRERRHRPGADPYWRVYSQGVEAGWS